MAEKYPNVNPYVYCLQNPINFTDPTGMSVKRDADSQWKPRIMLRTDSKGNVTGGYLALQKEDGDTAESLAATLNVSQEQANSLYNKMEGSKSNTIAVPESIAKPINNAINDIYVNASNYEYGWFPDTNYNCFESSISKGKTPDFDNVMTPWDFSGELKTFY